METLARFQFGDLVNILKATKILTDTALPRIQITKFKILILTKVAHYVDCLSHSVMHAHYNNKYWHKQCHTYINAVGVRIGENTAPQIGLNDYALTCTISGTVNRNVTYRWIKDSSTRIWNSTGTNSSILSFASPLKLSDAGNYTCEILIPRESPSLANRVMARAEASWVVTMESKLPLMHG